MKRRLVYLVLFGLFGVFDSAHGQTCKPMAGKMLPSSDIAIRLVDGAAMHYSIGAIALAPSVEYPTVVFRGAEKTGEFRSGEFLVKPGDTVSLTRDILIYYDGGSRRVDGVNGLPVDANIFPANGSVRYLLELRSAATDRTVWAGDTCAIYRTSEGLLRWKTLPKSMSRIRIPVAFLERPDSLYLAVRVVTELPVAAHPELSCLRRRTSYTTDLSGHILNSRSSQMDWAPPAKSSN